MMKCLCSDVFSTLAYGLIRTGWMGWSGLHDFMWLEVFGGTYMRTLYIYWCRRGFLPGQIHTPTGIYEVPYVSTPFKPVRSSSPSPDTHSHTLGTKQHDVVDAVNLLKLRLVSVRVGESILTLTLGDSVRAV